jgi:hypothetical protein
MLQVSLDCPFAIALTGLSNVSFPLVEQGLVFFSIACLVEFLFPNL